MLNKFHNPIFGFTFKVFSTLVLMNTFTANLVLAESWRERISGTYRLLSWDKNRSKIFFNVSIPSGELKIDSQGNAVWKLRTPQADSRRGGHPAYFKCTGRFRNSSAEIEYINSERINFFFWVPYAHIEDRSNKLSLLYLGLCGNGSINGREVDDGFSLFIEKQSDGTKFLEMNNSYGKYVWKSR